MPRLLMLDIDGTLTASTSKTNEPFIPSPLVFLAPPTPRHDNGMKSHEDGIRIHVARDKRGNEKGAEKTGSEVFLRSAQCAEWRWRIDSGTPLLLTYIQHLRRRRGEQSFRLNLFFDDDNTNPGISVYAPMGDANFLINSSSTLTLSGAETLGAGSVVYNSGGTTTTLTNYLYSDGTAYDLDRVGLGYRPRRFTDCIGQFTLSVVVPEPASAVGIGMLVMPACCGGGLGDQLEVS
jgi:hypothetical protein